MSLLLTWFNFYTMVVGSYLFKDRSDTLLANWNLRANRYRMVLLGEKLLLSVECDGATKNRRNFPLSRNPIPKPRPTPGEGLMDRSGFVTFNESKKKNGWKLFFSFLSIFKSSINLFSFLEMDSFFSASNLFGSGFFQKKWNIKILTT